MGQVASGRPRSVLGRAPLVMDGDCNGLLATTAGFLAWNQVADRHSVEVSSQ
ncbi:hypothetical protein [Streptomyces sp. NRRL S-646]|uniref:hypothetical protein n=1 Tax=Streptomyces sp. NRRL S-646 TaxID=1463917 RepID=UPI000AD3160B|nr:hypothetical protein [Streptomyces sp. NRRL S-646]